MSLSPISPISRSNGQPPATDNSNVSAYTPIPNAVNNESGLTQIISNGILPDAETENHILGVNKFFALALIGLAVYATWKHYR